MSEPQSNYSDRPKPTLGFHARLAELCKQSGVPHYTAEDPNPAHMSALEEIGGWMLFTPVTPSSKKPQGNAHKEEDCS